MIEVKNLNKSFDGVQILSDINASFEKGKVNLIIGQSGSGKTVLTKCIVGLHQVDSGEVLFDTKDVTKYKAKEQNLLRKSIGMLFQGGALFDSMTVEQNVMFPLMMFSDLPFDEMRDRANECISRVNLVNKNHLYPSETSGGMQKRIAIARAISMNPEFLFCDEPNSGLDPQTAIVIDELIKEITYEFNITTIVVTHDMNSVLEIGDTVLFIHKGTAHWKGNKETILQSDDPRLNDFVYASEFMRTVRKNLRFQGN
jgi:phospholipid/cholesterol/gamma-HCH transport system ATP-binding protein